MAVPHVALYLRFGNERCNRVDYNNVHCAAAHQRFAYFKGIFTGIRLGYIKLVHVNAKVFGIYRVKCMLSIYKRCGTAKLLRFCNYVQRNGGFTG